MLNFKIDHIVIGSRTLEEGSRYVEDLLNEELSPIGHHKMMGTHNRVLKLGNLYLEIIALDKSSKSQTKDCWFGLKENYVQDILLEGPKLISFVISSCEDKDLVFYKKKFFVSRGNYSWSFRRPKKSNINRKLFRYVDVFPSLINWKSESPLIKMQENPLLFLDLEIQLNKKQIYYMDFIKSFNLKEKINFFFNELDDLDSLPRLKANVIHIKNKKVFSLN